jgi:hypothetical protein
MTEYRLIYVKKRNFTIPVSVSLSAETVLRLNADDTRVTREGDTRVTREGDTRIARNTTVCNPPIIRVEKRSFTIQGKVQHG